MAYKQELCEPDIRMYVDDLRNRLRIRCVR